jgi:hypothetical protein
MLINIATKSNCGKLLKFNLLNNDSDIIVAQNKNCGSTKVYNSMIVHKYKHLYLSVTMIEIYGQFATNVIKIFYHTSSETVRFWV